MKYHRLISAATALLAICMLASCGEGTEQQTTTQADISTTASATESSTSASTAISMSALTIAEDGRSDFVIYRTKQLDDESLIALQELVTAIKAETGVTLQVVNDWGDAGEKDTDDAPAILIGRTSFAADALLSGLKLTQYTVSMSGNKLVIGGGDEESTAKAIRRFISDCVKGKGATLTFSPDQVILESGKYTADSYLVCLGEQIERFRIVIPKDADYAVQRCATRVSKHLSKLTGTLYPILTDAEATDAGAYEILIGKTARTTATAKENGYDISAGGKTVQIIADNWYGYERAAETFAADVAPLRGAQPITEATFRREDLTSKLKTQSPSLISREGEYRVLIHNIWGNTSEGNGDGRMLQTALLYEGYAPDIIGLQECSPTARSGKSAITALLKAQGYTEVPAVAKNTAKSNYTPLFYRADRFTLLEYGHVLFDGQNDSGSKGVTWGVFQSLTDGEKVAVLSTHYWWESKKPQDNLDRESNARQCLEVIETIKTKYDCPVILGGDFNCTDSSSPYGILTKSGMHDVQSTSAKTENVRTHHSYPTYDEDLGLWADPVSPSGGYEKSIDHILSVGEGLSAKRFDVVTDLYALLSSDHCPMVFDFDLN